MLAVPDSHSWTVEALPDLGLEGHVWDRIVDAMALPSPFLRTWWLSAVHTPDTRFLLVRDAAGRLRGGLPVTRRTRLGVSVVRFAGAGPLCPDHVDVVATPEDAVPVAAALDGWLRAAAPVALELDGLVQGATATDTWGPGEETDVAPYRSLSDPGDYLAALSSSHRLALRRAHTKLDRRGVGHVRLGSSDLEAALRSFRELQTGRAGRQSLVAALDPLETAVRSGHARGEVAVDLLRGPDGVAAVMISFVVGGRLSLYQVARSLAREDAGAGNVLMHTVFTLAAAGEVREIDMLRGAEAYKYKFVDHGRPLRRLRRGFGVRGRALVAAWNLATWGSRRQRALAQRLAEVSGRTRRLTAP